MAPVKNGRYLFLEPIEAGQGYPQPGKTFAYDSDETIDLENVPLNVGFLIKALVFSIDPYLRGRMRAAVPSDASDPVGVFEPGTTLVNFGVGRVIRTENASVAVGDHICGVLPFQEYSVLPNLEVAYSRVLTNEAKLPWSYYVNILGMPGQTAFLGWKEWAKPKENEVVYVSSAAGAVGSVVVQLARAASVNLKIIGSAGSDAKVKYLKELGVDVAFNYKTTDVDKVLEKKGPVNIYWDNVGGEQLDAALKHSARFARFIECGMISGYNNEAPPIKNLYAACGKSISLHGFINIDLHEKHLAGFFATVPNLVASGQPRTIEDISIGLENAGEAILAVQKGTTTGKILLFY